LVAGRVRTYATFGFSREEETKGRRDTNEEGKEGERENEWPRQFRSDATCV
jgi:hypothetical protein